MITGLRKDMSDPSVTDPEETSDDEGREVG